MTWEGLTPPYSTIVADPPWAYRTTKGITTRTSHGTACAEDNSQLQIQGAVLDGRAPEVAS